MLFERLCSHSFLFLLGGGFQKVYKHIIAVFLAFAIVFPFAIPFAFASAGSGSVLTDFTSKSAWDNLIQSHLKAGSDVSSVRQLYWVDMNSVMSRNGIGSVDSYNKLSSIVLKLQNDSRGSFSRFFQYITQQFLSLWTDPKIVVMYDDNLKVYRPYNNVQGLWVVNELGHFPYYRPDSPPSSPILPSDDISRPGKWVDRKIAFENDFCEPVSRSTLELYRSVWADKVQSNLYETSDAIYLAARIYTVDTILCNDKGHPYVYFKESNTAINQEFNYYDQSTNTDIHDNIVVEEYKEGDTVNNQFLDILAGTLNYNNSLTYIDSITFDESTKTYIVDSHDAYTYNATTNSYVTNNYRSEISYFVNYTSITYIGYTEQYDKEFQYYYELPDGRSSADLTAEDLEQLAISFHDIVPYTRSADNADMRALYHFDGDVDDSSYWGYLDNGFAWNSGASITYMDEGSFGGSLYLDETEHDFSINLPGVRDASDAFTFQFRFYSSYTASPKWDSYISIGDNTVLEYSGSQFRIPSGSVYAAPIGTWNELAFIASGGTLHYYLNGVPFASDSFSGFRSNSVRFHFGSTKQTYQKLDELRFSRGVIYPLTGYTPTAVPFDSNLALVLPDSKIPIADEVPVFKPSDVNILVPFGFADWTSDDFAFSTFSNVGTAYNSYMLKPSTNPFGFYIYEPSTFVSRASGGGVTLNTSAAISSVTYTSTKPSAKFKHLENCIFLPVFNQYGVSSAASFFSPFTSSVKYFTVSFVYDDFTSDSFTFQFGSYSKISFVSSSGPGLMKYKIDEMCSYSPDASARNYMYFTQGVAFAPTVLNSPVTILYSEVSLDDSSHIEFDYEPAFYDPDDLSDAPLLAVKTNRPITGYQIGGVRPSYPTKGLVYAMVENSRIRSLQQYTGYAWVEVDGRVWTGSRWIPYSSFDVFLLKDYFDISGVATPDDYEYIYTESGFWAWWQRQWLAFTSTLFGLLRSSGGGGDVPNISDDPLIDDEDKEPFEENTYIGIVKLLRSSFNFFSGLFSDFIVDGFGGYLNSLTDPNSDVYGILQGGGE